MIDRAIELLVDGIARGILLSLLGLGITLVFGLGEVLNLLIGVYAVLAVIAASMLLKVVPSITLAAIGGIAFVTVLAFLTDRSFISLVYREEGEERILLGIFVTLGLSITIEGLLYIYYPSSYLLNPGVPSLTMWGLNITGPSIAVIVMALALLAVIYAFFEYTFLGAATRTVIQDETGAALCGIDRRRIRSIIFVVSGTIAAAAGILYSFNAEVTAATAFTLTAFAIMVSIVGGVDSISGTIAAGLILGVIVTFAGALFGSYLATVTLFGVAVAVLIYRPEQIS